MGIDFRRQELLEFSVVPVSANANALIEARSYHGRQDPTLRELGAQLGRLIVAARLRNALPPRRTTYAERVAIAAALLTWPDLEITPPPFRPGRPSIARPMAPAEPIAPQVRAWLEASRRAEAIAHRGRGVLLNSGR